MSLIVQKYGGTAVGSIEKILVVARHTKSYVNDGDNIVVIVSAMAATTNDLIELARSISPNPSSREMDHLLQTGEIKTASLLAMALESIGVPAISFGAQKIGLVTTGEHERARIKRVKEISAIKKELKSKVVVIAGFQGLSEENQDITTLGRGGSDITAVAIAAALNAGMCEIYTDVDGVYAIDPRIVAGAMRFRTISHEQMLNMAAAGAGVLVDRSVYLAKRLGVDLKVLISPSMGESTGGTLVAHTGDIEDMEKTDSSIGVAIKKNLGVVVIPRIQNRSGEAGRIYKAIADMGINIVEPIQAEGGKTANINILLESKDADKVKEALGKIHKGISRKKDRVALYVIAGQMKEGVGYAAKTTTCLGKAGVNINMTGGALSALYVVINKKNLAKAANALALEFDLLN